MKKIKKILLILVFLFILFPKNILAEDKYKVYVNGKDIYDNRNTISGASFENNEGEFTLTLNNYLGEKILFKNFDETDIINIYIKGENTIDGINAPDKTTPTVGAIYSNTPLNFNIYGDDDSSLKINNYMLGISVLEGDISVDNLDLSFNKIRYGIATEQGSVSITNSKLDVKEAEYSAVYARQGNFDFINNKAKFEDVQIGFDLGSEKINIKDSEIMMYGIDTGIYNYYNSITIDNSTITMDNTGYERHLKYGIYNENYNIDVNNSNITMNNISNNKFFYELDESYFIEPEFGFYQMNSDININNSVVTINSKYTDNYNEENKDSIKYGYYIDEGKINFNNSEIHTSVDNKGTALVIYNYEEPEENLIKISENTKILEKDLSEKTYFIDEYIYCTSIGKNYSKEEILTVEDFENLMASEFNIEKIFKISFNSNGGTGTMDDVEVSKEYTLPENKFTAPENKKFKGWSLTKDGEIITTITPAKDTIIYAIWEDNIKEYTYEFINQEKENIIITKENNSIRIDGNYSLFKDILIEGLELKKDIDYTVTEGSTIIKFTDAGIEKINTLENGNYEIKIRYTNNKEVKGNLIIEKENPKQDDSNKEKENIDNPVTGDNIIIYIVISIISILGMITIILFKTKFNKKIARSY